MSLRNGLVGFKEFPDWTTTSACIYECQVPRGLGLAAAPAEALEGKAWGGPESGHITQLYIRGPDLGVCGIKPLICRFTREPGLNRGSRDLFDWVVSTGMCTSYESGLGRHYSHQSSDGRGWWHTESGRLELWLVPV